ncbi:MAG: NeuD/PglB/VioB family sugar acetyltransferase [Planctomycetes bacterium]|nr:NeuD/PglB/VioB family sugar acetyltransferase [Planctomycetota bacterium]
MITVDIAVFGAGGLGREVAWLAEECGNERKRYRVAYFVDDDAALAGRVVNGINVLGLEDAAQGFPGLKIVAGVRDPFARERIAERVRAAGLEFVSLVHPGTRASSRVDFGPTAVVGAGCVFTTNVKFGAHVHVQPHCTVGHDVILGDFCTLSPGVCVSGWVQLGKRVVVGAGAIFANGTEEKPLLVGHDAVIGAGAVVAADVPAGVTFEGVPARPVARQGR